MGKTQDARNVKELGQWVLTLYRGKQILEKRQALEQRVMQSFGLFL